VALDKTDWRDLVCRSSETTSSPPRIKSRVLTQRSAFVSCANRLDQARCCVAGTSVSGPGAAADPHNYCYTYAVLRESPGARRLTVCGRRERRTVIYTSLSNAVQVRIIRPRHANDDGATYFLLEYQGLIQGCSQEFARGTRRGGKSPSGMQGQSRGGNLGLKPSEAGDKHGCRLYRNTLKIQHNNTEINSMKTWVGKITYDDGIRGDAGTIGKNEIVYCTSAPGLIGSSSTL